MTADPGATAEVKTVAAAMKKHWHQPWVPTFEELAETAIAALDSLRASPQERPAHEVTRERHARLEAAGWTLVSCEYGEDWRSPDGEVVDVREALRRLCPHHGAECPNLGNEEE